MIASLWVEYGGSSLEAIPTECSLVTLGFLEVRNPRIVAKALAGIRTLAAAADAGYLGQGPGESETFR